MRSHRAAGESGVRAEKLSDQLERWLAGEGEKTLGGLTDVFQEKSFAVLSCCFCAFPPCRCQPGEQRTSSR